MNLSPHVLDKINAALNLYVTNPEPNMINSDPSIDLRKLAGELNLLPMSLDFGGCYGIRPNGDIFSFTWDEPYDLRPENDTRICNSVLFQGSKKYPELAALAPSRPPSAVVCNHCDGTGIDPYAIKLNTDAIVCYCGGLGWLPGDEYQLA
jgi:hypothetical protein